MFKKYNLKHYNFRMLALVVITSVFGLVIINSADSSYTLRQAGGIIGSCAWMIFLSFVDYKRILKHYRILYIVTLAILAAVLVLGTTAGGAQRWIVIAGFRMQPSEISKVLLVLFLSAILGQKKERLDSWKFLLLLAVLLLIPLGLIVMEPDLSQTILIFCILFTIIFAAEMPYRKLWKILAVVVPVVIILLIYIQNPDQKLLKPYQWYRVMAFINPEEYDDSVYQQHNAVQAIGSGGLTGKGLNTDDPMSLLNSDYIPEAHTDFIFAALGEQLGFVGCMAAIGLLVAIVVECVIIAVRSKDYSGRLLGMGFAAHIALQSLFNIGVVTQLLPNTGLALPFFTYGLSSLMTLYTAMGILLNVSLQREPYKEKDLYTRDFVDVKEFRDNNKKRDNIKIRF